jgi:hypothetical protein
MPHPILNKLIPGDVILTNQKGFHFCLQLIKLANFFKLGLGKRHWTHAAIYIGGTNHEIVESLQGVGVRRISLEKAYLDPKTHQLLIVRNKNITAAQLLQVINFCVDAAEKCKKYDLAALAYFLLYNLTPPQIHFLLGDAFLGKLFNLQDAYFCSELICTGLETAGAYCFEREPYKVMPVDFFNPLLFEQVNGIIEEQPKGNRFIYSLKAAFLWGVYLIIAFLFPLLVMVFAIGLGFIIAIVGVGIWGFLTFLVTLLMRGVPLVLRKKDDDISLKGPGGQV